MVSDFPSSHARRSFMIANRTRSGWLTIPWPWPLGWIGVNRPSSPQTHERLRPRPLWGLNKKGWLMNKDVKQCVGPYFWRDSQPTISLFAAATSRASLSCHYRRTSHGSGVASQRQERGGGVPSDLLFLRSQKGLFGCGRRRRGKEATPSLFLVIKGFWGTAWSKLLSAEFKDILLKLLKCPCAHAASRLHMWMVR